MLEVVGRFDSYRQIEPALAAGDRPVEPILGFKPYPGSRSLGCGSSGWGVFGTQPKRPGSRAPRAPPRCLCYRRSREPARAAGIGVFPRRATARRADRFSARRDPAALSGCQIRFSTSFRELFARFFGQSAASRGVLTGCRGARLRTAPRSAREAAICGGGASPRRSEGAILYGGVGARANRFVWLCPCFY